jgi:hypothetical protein
MQDLIFINAISLSRNCMDKPPFGKGVGEGGFLKRGIRKRVLL